MVPCLGVRPHPGARLNSDWRDRKNAWHEQYDESKELEDLKDEAQDEFDEIAGDFEKDEMGMLFNI